MARIVVVGASQGGVEALHSLVGALPEEFTAPLLIVQHIGASPSILPSILNDADGSRAAFAKQGEELRDGRIYIAPPDHHMMLRDGQLELSHGPRENWSRPAVDPLFRTAAQYYGPDVIGVVLTGRLNDGTSGLYEIKRQGGIAVVQTPGEAEAPDMPQSALDHVAIDYCLPVAEMPRLLMRLTAENNHPMSHQRPRVMTMVQQQFDTPTAQTCPECGGAMRQESVGSLTRFRCHIGHVMTAEVLAASQLERLQDEFSSAVRTLNERAALCREIGGKYASKGNDRAAENWEQAAKEAEEREGPARQIAEASWLHPEAPELVK